MVVGNLLAFNKVEGYQRYIIGWSARSLSLARIKVNIIPHDSFVMIILTFMFLCTSELARELARLNE